MTDSGTFAAINSSLGDLMRNLPKHPDYAQLDAQKPRYHTARPSNTHGVLVCCIQHCGW